MPERVARHVVVHGHVQGVWFRAECRDMARAHGVDGWVRNRQDGHVEALLEGPDEGVQSVIDWIRAGGPPRAHVTRVQIEDVAATGEAGFRIVH